MDRATKTSMSLVGRNFMRVGAGKCHIEYDGVHGKSNPIPAQYKIYDVHSDLLRLKCIITFQHYDNQQILFQIFPVNNNMTVETRGNNSIIDLQGHQISFLNWSRLPPAESGVQFLVTFQDREVGYEVFEGKIDHAKSVFNQISELMTREY